MNRPTSPAAPPTNPTRRRTRLVVVLAVIAVLVGMSAGPAHADARHRSSARRNPVVIVPGILVGPLDEFVYYPLRDRLRAAGYDTTVFTKPWYGLDGVHPNAERLKSLVDDIRARTGAPKVDIVAHSQGGLVTRDYLKYLDGADAVDHAILMASPNQGTLAVNLVNALVGCLGIIGCQEMDTNSTYIRALNAGDQTIGDVKYTTIVTRYDELALPYTTGFLPEGDGNVVNIDIQAQCPAITAEHLFMLFSGAVVDGITDALQDRRVRLDCAAG